jgi:CubicO group peptidase (beta-lactamase class C family)
MIDKASSTRRSALLGAAALTAVGAPEVARATAPAGIDDWASRAIAAFGVPGMAIAVVEGDRTVHSCGYGVRKLDASDPVGVETAFPIGSCSKTFTAAALAILVDEGKLGWDDPVARHLPGFAMYDDYVSQQITVRDVLAHRSGLGDFEGELLVIPDTDFSRAEIVERLRYMKPAMGFRSGAGYSNILYVAAGELVRALSGQSWDDFVQARILMPLGMEASAPSFGRLKTSDRVFGHARVGGPIIGTGRMRSIGLARCPENASPAGGICSSARDMALWLSTQLAMGQSPNGVRLWSEAQAKAMWRPESIVGGSPRHQSNPGDYHLILWALGWGLKDIDGLPVLTRPGGVLGASSLTTLIPEKNVGFIVMINANEEAMACCEAVSEMLIDHYTGVRQTDWIASFKASADEQMTEAITAAKAAGTPPAGARGPSRPLDRYAGCYRDPWYGDVVIDLGGTGLTIAFSHTPALKGRLEPWAFNTFRTAFDDPLMENAFVTFFPMSNGAIEHAKLDGVSPSEGAAYRNLLLKKMS